MRHYILLICLFSLLVSASDAQTPMYNNGTSYTSGNSVPLAYQTNIRTQLLMPGSIFTTTPPSGMLISRIYFMTNNSSTLPTSINYTNLVITMGNVSLTSLSGTSWASLSGLTVAMNAASYTLSPINGQTWISIPLTTNVPYDPSLPFLIDVSFTAQNMSNNWYINTSGSATGNYYQYGYPSTSSTPSNVTNERTNFGIDLVAGGPPPVLGPLPTITYFSPTTGPIGLTDTIYGTNFSTTPTDNIVNYGAVRANVLSASANSLVVNTPAGLTYHAPSVNVNGLTAFANKPFLQTYPNSGNISATGFANQGNLNNSYYNSSVANADLDNDGKVDLIVCSNSYLYIYRNIGATGNLSLSSFATPVILNLSGGANQVITADVDGDGRLDILVSNPSYNTFSYFRNVIPANGGSITAGMFYGRYDVATGSTPYKIAAGDLDGDGKVDVVSVNNYSNTISVFRNTGYPGLPSFAAAQNYTTGAYPMQCALADIDSDGKLDIAVTNSSSNTMSVYKNNCTSGTISFASQVTFTTGSYPNFLTAGDIDGDNKPDLVVSNNNSNTISIYRNTGLTGVITAGSLAAGVYFSTLSFPYEIKLAELNGDGKAEIVVSNNGSSSFSVFQNNAASGIINTGSMGTRQDYTTTNNQSGLCIGDMDNDNRADICLVSGNSTGTFIHKNNMSIFSVNTLSPLIYAIGSSISVPFTVTLPITIANIFTAQLSDSIGNFANPTNIGSIIGTGSGTISATLPITASPGTQYLVRVVSSSPSYISQPSSAFRIVVPPVISSFLPLIGPPGTKVTINGNYFSSVPQENVVYFGPVKATIVSSSATTLIVTVPKSATASPITVNCLSYSCTSSKSFTPTYSGAGIIATTTFGSKVDFTTNTNPMNIDLADIDMDGKPDVILPNNSSGNLAVYKNNATTGIINTSTLGARVSFTTAGSPWHAQMIDIDGDGLKDMVSGNNSVSTLSINRNMGQTGLINTSSFDSRVDFTSASSIQYIGYADIDGDGKTDLATANPNTNNISLFRNISASGTISSSSFATRIDMSTGASSAPICVVFNDIDLDGRPDMLVANSSSNTIGIYSNTSSNGAISFGTAVTFTTLANPRYITFADINNDGKPDIVVSNSGGSTISVFENLSASGIITTSSFGTRVDITTATNPWGIATGDLDGDGKIDLATACNGGSISVIKNTYTSGSISSSSFAPKVDFTAGSQPNGIAICDIDGDLKPEILVSSYASSIVSVFPNIGGALSLTPISGQLCNGGQLIVSFTTSISFNISNVFTAQLSDSSGSFATPVNIGSLFGTTSGNINANLSGIIQGTKYRIRITSSSPAMVSTDNLSDLWISNCPSITNVSPLTAGIGSTVTISGTNFSSNPANNVVYFGAVRANVTSANPTTITTTVPLGVTYEPVSVTTLNNYLTASYTRSFNSTFVGPNTTFPANIVAPGTAFAAKPGSFGTAVGDIDGDGKTDVVSSSNNSATVSVFRNINASPGSFTTTSLATRIDLALSGNSNFVKLSDIDGDGKLDLICFLNSTNQISIFRNTSSSGNISFAARVDIATLNTPNSGLVSDVDNDGKPELLVPNYGSASMSVFKNTNLPGNITTAGFSLRADYATYSSPYSIAQGDFDNDGKMDYVVGNANSGLNIFRNTGVPFGSFLFTNITLSTGTSPYFVNTADIDNDGKTDIVSTNLSSNTVNVYRNNYISGTLIGSSFTAGTNLSAPTSAFSTAFTDMDGDGRPDLVVASQSSSGYLSFFRNTSSVGAISFDPRVDAVSGLLYYSIEPADMDNDGRPDITGITSSGYLYVWRNNLTSFATGNITTTSPYCSGAALSVPFTAPTGYFSLSNIFTAQLSDSAGTFNNPVSIGTYIGTNSGTINASLPGSMLASNNYRIRVIASSPSVIAQDNGANISIKACLIINSFSPLAAIPGATVTIQGSNFGSTPGANIVYFGSVKATVLTASNSQLTVRVPTGAIVSQLSVTVGNFIAFSQQLFVPSFAGNSTITTSTFSPRADIISSLNGIRGVFAGDFDGDGKPDMNAPVSGLNVAAVYRNLSSPGEFTGSSFGTVVSGTSNNQPWHQATADFDNDGKLDIAVVNVGSNNISVFRNTSTPGSISLSLKTDFTIATSASPYSIASGDIDGDGLVDLVTANLGLNSICIFRNISTGSVINFAAPVSFTTPTQPASVVIAEFDGDGKADICVGNFGANSISIFRNTSSSGSITTSSLGTRQDFISGTAPFYMCNSDIDGDGKTDLIVPNYSAGTISIFRNTSSIGTVNFAAKVDYTVGSNPISITTGDLDGDNKPDIAVANLSASTISVFKNTSSSGTINLALKVDFTTQSQPLFPVICDFDSDGRNDLALANSGSNSISIFRNKSFASQPTIQATSLSLSNITGNSITLNWTAGNGVSRIVLARLGSAVNSTPLDSTSYNANSIFASGSQIGSGNYVVYSGTDNSVVVTGLTANTNYYFSVFEFNGSGGASNYLITTPASNNGTTLPVTLIDFKANYKDKNVTLLWTTGTEINNLGFTIERSEDNQNWNNLGFVNGSGNSNTSRFYNYTDNVSAFPNDIYLFYRLLQTDFDGNTMILPVRAVRIENTEADGMVVFPNPSSNVISLNIKDIKSEIIRYSITNIMGSLIVSDELNIKNSQAIEIESLPNGVYFLKVENGNEIITRKFVKE